MRPRRESQLALGWRGLPGVMAASLAVATSIALMHLTRTLHPPGGATALIFVMGSRTEEAKHTHETPWTMTLPLGILAVFAIGVGWVGIPSDFLGLDLPENWFHGFVGGTVAEHPAAVPLHVRELAARDEIERHAAIAAL